MINYRIATKDDINLLTEISLDATQSGRALNQKCGFVDSTVCVVLNLSTA